MKREITIFPAWDKRNPDPKRDYGIHSMEVRFILIGGEGAVSWIFATGIFLPGCLDNLGQPVTQQPYGASLCYHSPTPRYEGHERSKCDLLPEGFCYDGCTFTRDDLAETLIREGSNALWVKLEEFYNARLT